MFFSKPETLELYLPLRMDRVKEEKDSGIITLEAWGEIQGKRQYLNGSYSLKEAAMYDDGRFEKMLEELDVLDRLSEGAEDENVIPLQKKVKVVLTLKKGKVKKGIIDLDSLAQVTGDMSFVAMELLSWGLNENSCIQR